MTLFELNFISLIIISLSIYFILGFDTNFKSLVISEFFWMSLYIFALIMSFLLDDLNILSLIFFFLIFSAVDVSLGLILIIIQKKIFKSLNFFFNSNTKLTFISRKNKFMNYKKLFY